MATAGQRFILVARRYRRFRIDLFERKGAKEAKAQRKNVFCCLVFAPLLTLRLVCSQNKVNKVQCSLLRGWLRSQPRSGRRQIDRA